MNKIPTAKEYIKDLLYTTRDEEEDVHDTLSNVENAMIEFAKLHVEAALKSASEHANMQIEETMSSIRYISHSHKNQTFIVAKDSILNSYPLDQIK